MSSSHSPSQDNKEDNLISHLIELRSRLVKIMLGVGAVFLCLVPFSNELYTWLAGPLIAQLPEGRTMIAIDVTASFLIPLKLTLLLSFALTIPWVLYQVWAFVAPGLYRHEQQLVLPVLISSSLLFYLGALFAYYVVFPLAFGFFTKVAPVGIEVTPDIASYLSLVMKLFIAFGVAFETPVLTFLLIKTGVTTRDNLAAKRSYIIVVAFVVGMILTPPDVISQVLLAIPVWLLFELGLLMSAWIGSPKKVISDEASEPRYVESGDDELAEGNETNSRRQADQHNESGN